MKSLTTYEAASLTLAAANAAGVRFTGVTAGYAFDQSLTTDVDSIIGVAINQNLVNDVLLTQIPLSVTLGLRKTCNEQFTFGNGFLVPSALRGRSVCVADNGALGQVYTLNNDKALATAPRYTFGYPLNAGVFPTRATAMDLFQTVYDALGTLHSQEARSPLVSSPFAAIPGLEALVPGTGLADLSTQAPPVNDFGFQLDAGNALLNGLIGGPVTELLRNLQLGTLQIRHHEASSQPMALLGLDLDGDGLGDSRLMPNIHLGPTAVYRAAEVRTGQINILAVRWHNIGLATAGNLLDNLLGQTPLAQGPLGNFEASLPSAPATFYHDVPEGQYTISDARVDSSGGVYVNDWDATGDAPNLAIPPNKADPQGLLPLVESLTGTLGALVMP